jgi:hypothetical protein
MPTPSDFQDIAAAGQQEQGGGASPTQEAELHQALGGMRDFQARLVTQNKMAEDPMQGVSEMKINNKTGEMTAKFHKDTLESLIRDHKQLNEIRGSFHQEAERLKAQEEKVRSQSPWITLATTLSSHMAQQRNMPGWVQAAGGAAAELNPSADKIRDKRLGVLSEEAQLAERGAGLDMEQERMDRDTHKEERLTAKNAMDERAKFQTESVNAAMRGEGDPAATTALGVKTGVLLPEQAEAFRKNLEGIQKSYTEKQDKATKVKMETELRAAARDEEKQLRVFKQQDKIVAARMAATEAATEKKAALAEKKGEAKKAELKDFETKELEQYVAADKALDEVEKLLKTDDAKKYMGYASGTLARIGAKYAPNTVDPNGVIAGIDSKLKLQTAQAIKSTGAGARGFGPMERPFFEGLAEGITRTPAQNQHIIDVWREYLDQGRKGVLANHTDETLKKYPKMFGSRMGGGGETAKRFVFNQSTGKIEEQ